jgi:two-component system sensor histidine kinase RpfC
LEEIHALTSRAQGKQARRTAPRSTASPPAPPSGAQAEVVNAETLAHLQELGSNSAFLEKLVSVFVADNGALIGRMEHALAGRNYQEVRALLHAMKGSAASMGTDRLTALCGTVGKLSDAEICLQSSTLVRTLSDELAMARRYLEGYLQKHRQSAG